MARMRQTSKKTTGGPAKRGKLKMLTGDQTGKQVVKTLSKFPHALKSPSPVPEDSDIPSKATATTMLKPSFQNIYCILCRDGGIMYDCSYCPRSVCDICLLIPEEFQQQVKGVNVRFICPGCHEVRGNHDRTRGMTPYFGFEDADSGEPIPTVPITINGHAELTSRSQVSSDPILILYFVLKTLQSCGSPAPILREELQLYKSDDHLQYHEITFDIGTPVKAAKHAVTMMKLVDEVKHLRYERVEIFIYSHSETTRGDIWGGFENDKAVGKGRNKVSIRGEPVAYTVDDMFRGLFVGGIEDYVKGATLWMLVCGHTVRELEAFTDFKACIKRYEIEHAFAFGAELFHASLTTSFITAYVERVLVEGLEVQDVMQDLLIASPRLAMHSSVIHLHLANAFRRRQPTIKEYNQGQTYAFGKVSMTVSTYTFFHTNKRPWGNALPYQCSQCKCVRTWRCVAFNVSAAESRFACQECGHTITYTRPDDKESHIILFSQGYLGTSSLSGKLVKKGKSTASGWLVSVSVESGTPEDV